MKLVIEIPEEAYRCAVNNLRLEWISETEWVDAVRNGTPLPKGHGRIGDLDKIAFWLISSGLIDDMKCGEVADIFRQATIIEADKESEE